MNKNIVYLIIAIVIIVIGLFAFNGFLAKEVGVENETPDIVEQDEPQDIEPIITQDGIVVPDQAGGDSVFIEKVLLKESGSGGFVVIHEVGEDGELGDTIGASQYFEPGSTEIVEVLLNEGVTVDVGDTLIAVLYGDDGDKVFNAELDQQLVNDAGDPVTVQFSILAEEDLPGFEVKM